MAIILEKNGGKKNYLGTSWLRKENSKNTPKMVPQWTLKPKANGMVLLLPLKPKAKGLLPLVPKAIDFEWRGRSEQAAGGGRD